VNDFRLSLKKNPAGVAAGFSFLMAIARGLVDLLNPPPSLATAYQRKNALTNDCNFLILNYCN
jgi:hypothetical protein